MPDLRGDSGLDVTIPSSMCAADVITGEAAPVDLLLLVDSSTSMVFPAGPRSKWAIVTASLQDFMKDPRSAGLGVGLQFFPTAPSKVCQSDAECGSGICWRRAVCWGAQGVVGPEWPPCMGDPQLCPSGSACRPVGFCSLSNADCVDLGRPCALDGGVCTASRNVCFAFANNPGECTLANYAQPNVALGVLPAAQPTLSAALLDRYPLGSTPLGPAVEGAMAHLRTQVTTTPGRKTFLVLVSDGLPEGCSDSNQTNVIADRLAKESRATPSIGTFVIGTFAANEIGAARPQLDKLAVAGGTNQAFVLTATGDLTTDLSKALSTIRGTALDCDYKIPPPKQGPIDFGKVNVRLTTAAGPQDDLLYVASVDKCDPTRGGWYYDVDPKQGTPSRIKICETSCTHFQSQPNARVDLLFGCAARTVD